MLSVFLQQVWHMLSVFLQQVWHMLSVSAAGMAHAECVSAAGMAHAECVSAAGVHQSRTCISGNLTHSLPLDTKYKCRICKNSSEIWLTFFWGGQNEIFIIPLFEEGAGRKSSRFKENVIRQSTLDCIWLCCSSLCNALMAWWLRHPPREQKTQGSNPVCDRIFLDRVIPVTQKLALQWLPC